MKGDEVHRQKRFSPAWPFESDGSPRLFAESTALGAGSRLVNLRHRVSEGTYSVHCERVAAAILERLGIL